MAYNVSLLTEPGACSPMPTPLSLSDDEYAAVMRAAEPVHRLQRDAFLQALARELEKHSTIGPGVVHRCAAQLQRQFGVEAHSETSHAATPRRRA
jgi:hypothetical protein